MTAIAKPTETAFIRLDGRIGWRMDAGLSDSLYVDPAGDLRLGRAGVYPIAANEPFGSFGGNTLPTGIAIRSDGRIVLADPGGNRLLYYVPPFGREARPKDAPDYWPFRPLWVPPPPEPAAAACTIEAPVPDPRAEPYRLRQPRDVTFNPAGDLVVADEGRLLILAWPQLQVRHVLVLPGGMPAAVAFDSRGNGYVADVKNRVVRRFDALWRLDCEYPGGKGELLQPEHVAIDAADNVFVLDSATQTVVMFDKRGRVVRDATGAPLAELRLYERRFPPPLQLSGAQLEYPQPHPPLCGTLVLSGIEVDKAGRLAGTRLPLLARPQRIALPRRGVYFSERLDSGLPGFQWHRLVLALQLPSSTRLIVQTHASDVPLEPERIRQLGDDDWSSPLLLNAGDLPEILVQSGPGRHLWLKLEFSGDGDNTPLLSAIEIQAPRRSSLRWLPPPFRSDPDSAHFLDRYLSYFDTVFAESQHEIENFARLLDPYSVPAGEFLEWLGSWFDWRFLAEWPEATRREMIAGAIGFFRRRGTVEGLRRLLQWHTGLSGEQPQIIEHFRLRDYAARRQPGGDLVDGSLHIGGKPLSPERMAHWFTIVMPSSAVPDAAARERLTRLIEAQKPAHAGFELRLFDPGIRIGCQSTIGVDMWVGDYPAEALGGMRLGQSSRLAGASAPGFGLGAGPKNDLQTRAEGSCS